MQLTALSPQYRRVHPIKTEFCVGAPGDGVPSVREWSGVPSNWIGPSCSFNTEVKLAGLPVHAGAPKHRVRILGHVIDGDAD